jgi:hypothetical protein
VGKKHLRRGVTHKDRMQEMAEPVWKILGNVNGNEEWSV